MISSLTLYFSIQYALRRMMMQPMMMQPMMGGPMMQQPMVQNAGPTFQQVSDDGKVAAKEETTVVEDQSKIMNE